MLTLPIGVFLPILWNKYFSSIKSLATIGLGISLLIEVLQYMEGILLPSIYTRASDVNDLILNTLGVLIGYFVFKNLSKNQIVQKKLGLSQV